MTQDADAILLQGFVRHSFFWFYFTSRRTMQWRGFLL
jgi:hypothetical protein